MKRELTIQNCLQTNRGYTVQFSVNDPHQVLRADPITLSYDRDISSDMFWPINAALACLLPVMVREYGAVRVKTPVRMPQECIDYWNAALKADRLPVHEISWSSVSDETLPVPRLVRSSGRVGLLFGGGIESMFALSQLHEQKPLCISITGPGWMNNDEASYGIKRQLEDEMVAKQAVDLTRASSNAFSLILRDDLYRNRYVTGLLFYWIAAPLCFIEGLSLLFKSSELEEALNFTEHDLSLAPMFQTVIGYPGHTYEMAVFNGFSKVKMLEYLSATPYLEYVYSCFYNSNARWCGKCTKCYRISEYCERIGIPRSRLGMKDGFIGKREIGSISKHYWALMDEFYGRRRGRELAHAWELSKRSRLAWLRRVKKKLVAVKSAIAARPR